MVAVLALVAVLRRKHLRPIPAFQPAGNPWVWIAPLIPWIIFSLYWEIAAGKTREDAKRESNWSRLVHSVLANGALLLILIPVPGLRLRVIPNVPAWHWVGQAIEWFGLALAIWARRTLGANWSGRITAKVGHELIRSGPYKRVRHPIYTGILGMYAGTAIYVGGLHAVLGAFIALAAYLRKLRLEEANMEAIFGKSYAEYRKMSWALVPWVG